MPRTDPSANSVSVALQEEPNGHANLALRGRLDVESTGSCWRDLERRLKPLRVSSLDIDVSHLELSGGIGIALLRYLHEGGMTPGAAVNLHGLGEELQKLLNTFTSEDFRSFVTEKRVGVRMVEVTGRWLRGVFREMREQIAFIGSITTALPVALVHPKLMRWGRVKHVMERAGANALPVVGVFSWLVGLVLALEASHPLEKFGAQIFIADMIGFSNIRDTGPLVTAIMLAGRSGSAFAAELGTMKVNQELDALTTMGLDPVRFLVVHRMFAALLLTPLLSIYAMVLGMCGGIMVMSFLGFSWSMIYHQLLGRIHTNDIVVGLTKALLFGLIVGAVGCLRGLQTREGPQAVGVSATRSVVSGILLVIFANTIYSAVQYFYNG